MNTVRRNKRIVWLQIAIVIILAALILFGSMLSFDNGIMDEDPFLSLDPDSPDYYMTRLNSEDVTFASPVGFEYVDFINDLFPKATVVGVTSWEDMMLRIGYGKENAFMAEEVDAELIIQGTPTLYHFPEYIATSHYSFAIRKDEKGAEILSQFNTFWGAESANGNMQALADRWANVYSGEEVVLPLELTYAEDAPVLNAVIIPTWCPYVYVPGADDGAYCGIFIDYFNAFCAANGYRPNYISTTSYDAAIMGLSNGQYDIYLGGIVPSPEREEALYLTDTIASENLYLFTRVTEVEGIDAKEYVGDSGFFTYLKNSLSKNLVEQDRWKMLATGFRNTLILAISSAIFGTLLGAIIYFLDSQKNLLLSAFGRLYINIFQRLPDVLLLLLLCYVVFGQSNMSGMLVCIIAFSMSFAAMVAETLRSGVDAIPTGQRNAALALGFSNAETFFRIILPQVVRNTLPVYRGLIITLILETSIAGYIAVEDLTKMSDLIRASTFEALIPMLISALIYFLVTTILGLAFIAIERSLDPSHRRRLPKWVEQLQTKT